MNQNRGGQKTVRKKCLRFRREEALFEKRWHKILEAGDPYYNVNLTLKNGNCTLRAYD